MAIPLGGKAIPREGESGKAKNQWLRNQLQSPGGRE